jgi:hypothetical protein
MAIAGRKIFTSFITFISFFFWGLALQNRADKPKSLTTTTRKRLLPGRFLSRILVVNLERKFTGVDPFGGAPRPATTHFAGVFPSVVHLGAVLLSTPLDAGSRPPESHSEVDNESDDDGN